MKERLLYNLGWDYASLGLSVDESEPEDLLIGYREGKAHFQGKTKQADVYTRKWLQLRYNALKRDRHFEDDVTPEFLQKIVTPVCPISRVKLTAGTLTESDWSIDRIINDGGYAQNNLMVMATAVNQAKGSLSLSDIFDRMKDPQMDTRLKPIEWARMFSIAQHVYDKAGLIPKGEYLLTPIVAHKPLHLGFTWDNMVQNIILHYVFIRKHGVKVLKLSPLPMQDWTQRIKRSCDDPISKPLFHKLVSRLERKVGNMPDLEDLMWDQKTFDLFTELFRHQVIDTKKWPIELPSSRKSDNTPDKVQAFRSQIAFDTHGYLPLAR